MPSPSGFLQALGAAFQGYGQDQSLRDAAEEKSNALEEKKQQAAAALAERTRAAQAAEQTRQDGMYLKGVRQGPTPDGGAINSAMDLAASANGGLATAGSQSIRAADPEKYATDRFQAMPGNQYMDTYAAPEAVASRHTDQVAANKAQQDAVLEQYRQRLQDRREALTRASAERIAARNAASQDTKGQLVSTGVDASGKQVYRWFNKNSKSFEDVGGDITPKDHTGAGDGGLKEGRKLAAISEARLADGRMRDFEDKMLDGTENISPLNQMAGNLTANLAGAHTVTGAGAQAISEAGLNMAHPTYAQYLRDAATIGRAEQMIMPKGGTETMVRANALLARAGSGANKATIDASRMARQALFGKAGGLAQTMSPEATTKLESGLERIKSGGTGKGSATPQLDALRHLIQ